MKIKLYDRVKLKSGYEASVVEILEENKIYICDIDKQNDTFTDFVTYEEIDQIID